MSPQQVARLLAFAIVACGGVEGAGSLAGQQSSSTVTASVSASGVARHHNTKHGHGVSSKSHHDHRRELMRRAKGAARPGGSTPAAEAAAHGVPAFISQDDPFSSKFDIGAQAFGGHELMMPEVASEAFDDEIASLIHGAGPTARKALLPEPGGDPSIKAMEEEFLRGDFSSVLGKKAVLSEDLLTAAARRSKHTHGKPMPHGRWQGSEVLPSRAPKKAQERAKLKQLAEPIMPPSSCLSDEVVKKACGRGASAFACLTAHQERLSAPCLLDLRRQLPSLCTAAISRHCDLLNEGALECLSKHFQDADVRSDNPCHAATSVVLRADRVAQSKMATPGAKAGESTSSSSRDKMAARQQPAAHGGGKKATQLPPPSVVEAAPPAVSNTSSKAAAAAKEAAQKTRHQVPHEPTSSAGPESTNMMNTSAGDARGALSTAGLPPLPALVQLSLLAASSADGTPLAQPLVIKVLVCGLCLLILAAFAGLAAASLSGGRTCCLREGKGASGEEPPQGKEMGEQMLERVDEM
eukprot:TRINITY_DN45054_c0_g1_i1.p1 TRINITY_DN45054_c0_g1~~TRINITY_DN45054_c0_g1_i1.p1  ORF type:complete len:567 (-),score=137.66 TRINITY_DN45054_c0_g1_i1:68-1639(-)